MGTKKKLSMVPMILCGIAAVGLILFIIGICLDFVRYQEDTAGKYALGFFQLGDVEGEAKSRAVISMIVGYATLILTIGCVLLTALKLFGKNFVMPKKVVGFLAILLGLAVFGCAFLLASKINIHILMVQLKAIPAAGAWLMAIGAVVSGIACYVSVK